MIHTARKKQFGLSALALFVLLLFLLVCVTLGLHWWRDTSGPALHPPRSRFDPLAHCATPHGTLLGYALDIPAFSNCHRRWNSKSQAFVTLEHPHDVRQEPFLLGTLRSRSTGVRWVAAEFIARTYYLHRGMSFIYGAPDAPEYWLALEFHGPMVREREYETLELLNSAEATTAKERKRLAPRVFDVVVWSPMEERDLPEGHIAVVVQVEDDVEAAGGEDRLRELRKLRLQPRLLYIAEQNFDNTHWGGKNYSRVLRFQWRNGREAVLQDPLGLPIIGRVRPGRPKQNTDVEDDL
ncbi:hypothetical protein C3747_45g221 [Trypanosoma cruzi]|uniref:D-alanyl-glycyl endopeptidase-like protein n=5 Tax=Trypanosoma cruzi TaxID=5693 RepID=Q4CUZ4_TRYCC|nr:hypothetical protein, conserved [Trypanosoma cruzi]XP_805948.1 hypothetical protein, conserved [Trypanosoma cruzi]EAN84095.1 hypothetical protein, conserved [Trypanosoma cruzi]EAN84097.1 hypothetical protein, conserved [Trypanosoma cruzi]PWV13105.1 hypothetical protein C3747_45g230 [Trypanosoma cruzi]PWV13107.1 hypothetical protein C3747_45g227 [Trypanosoma cruzi]PWV13109.1 hypothetical protein C3747_45g224 [Trypanosoma cruzi]|eukprot:XP_805946.1 hypothetical protein [Trypanosoma cruzi strain CL Brener]